MSSSPSSAASGSESDNKQQEIPPETSSPDSNVSPLSRPQETPPKSPSGRKKSALVSFWEEKEKASSNNGTPGTRPTPIKFKSQANVAKSPPRLNDVSKWQSTSSIGEKEDNKVINNTPNYKIKIKDSVKVVVYPPLPPSNAVFKNEESPRNMTEDASDSVSIDNLPEDIDIHSHDDDTTIVHQNGGDGNILQQSNDVGTDQTIEPTEDSKHVSFNLGCDTSEADEETGNPEHEFKSSEGRIANKKVIEPNIQEEFDASGIESAIEPKAKITNNEQVRDEDLSTIIAVLSSVPGSNGNLESGEVRASPSPSEESRWWKRNRRVILILLILLVIIAIVGTVLGVVLSPKSSDSDANKSKGGDNGESGTSGNADVADAVAEVTSTPSNAPSLSALPTATPTAIPSNMPSTSPTACEQKVTTQVKELGLDLSNNSTYTKIAMKGGNAVAATESGYVVFYSLLDDNWEQTQAFRDATKHNHSSVAISGRLAVVGYPYDEEIRVYEQDESTGVWEQVESPLFNNGEGENGARFGWSVGVSADNENDGNGGIIVVGAPKENNDTGSVYVFESGGDGNWTEMGRFVPNLCDKERFGRSVAIEKTFIAMSADCEANVQIFEYDKSMKSFSKNQNLYYIQYESGAISSMDMNGNNLVYTTVLGEVMVFERNSSNQFIFQQQIDVSDNDGLFDYPVAISRDMLVVGVGNKTRVFSQESGGGLNGLFWKKYITLDNYGSNNTIASSSVAMIGHDLLVGSPEKVYAYDFEDCAEPIPTQMPSIFISKAPVVATEKPSTRPSNSPTSSPSTIPSAMPSTPPSNSATSETPSSLPSAATTTFEPSSVPSFLPSLNPSSIPTSGPTIEPSPLPSILQSSQPTESSTLPLSDQPSQFPTPQASLSSSKQSILPTNTLPPNQSFVPSKQPAASQIPSASTIFTSPQSLIPSQQPTALSVMPTTTCYNVEITVFFDNSPLESGWVLTKIDPEGQSFVDSFFPPDSSFANERDVRSVCLEEGNYSFTMYDMGGDGMTGGINEDDNGSYAVIAQGMIVAQGAAFEFSETTQFAIPFI